MKPKDKALLISGIFGGIWFVLTMQIIAASQNYEARWYIFALLAIQLILSYFVFTRAQKVDEEAKRKKR